MSVPYRFVKMRKSRKLPRRRHFKGRLWGRVWPRQKCQGRHLAEAVMGPLGVVGLEPGLGDLAHLLEGVEEIGVEDFFSETPIEPLDEGILYPAFPAGYS